MCSFAVALDNDNDCFFFQSQLGFRVLPAVPDEMLLKFLGLFECISG